MIGLAHAFLLFWGDILYPYALCGLILFPFRKLPARKLLIIGGLFIAFKTGWSAVDAFRQLARRNLAAAADAAEKAGRKPTEQESAAEAGAGRAAETAKAFPRRSGEGRQDVARQPWAVIGARANDLAIWHGLPLYDPGLRTSGA